MKGRSLPAIFIVTASLMGFAAHASAQAVLAAPANHWDHGTTLDVLAGAASASGDWRGAFGGALGWEINHRVEIEGTGTWLVANKAADTFAAELKVVGSLTRPRTVVPLLGAGIGLYHASFDTTRDTLPAFYQRRVVSSGVGTIANFTDPSFVLSGGADIFTGRHISVRPDVSVRLVRRSSNTYAVTLATVYLTYHFEEHGE